MILSNLIVSHYRWIVQSAYKFCRNRMDAEDLAEETIFKMLSNSNSFNEEKPFKPWCSVIMLNTYITAYNRDLLVYFEDEEKGRNEMSATDTDQQVGYSELLDIVEFCRGKSCSIDCVMMYARGYSYDEIAESMGIPVGTVRSRISYGRDLLRKHFAAYMGKVL